jgi:hypothetical protein
MSSVTPHRRTLVAAFSVGTMLLAVVTAHVAQAAAVPRPVKVLTRNLYLGADLTPAIVATTPLALALAGTQIWNTVLATGLSGPCRAARQGDRRRRSGSHRPPRGSDLADRCA